ncbi:substrate-binding periplasmic protein [Pseudoalteromonas citrea]|uniref:substrate-binding periplasmic protein n=1 Tax=Pseudoalteromonas citrea TaxID=43655 RepID=UPI00201699B1|nr:transporter substrate-binding domain-containing protein [Pseudoalteromonas citrea]
MLPEIYNRLGIKVIISPLPGKRAQQEAQSGLKDGEVMRIYSYGTETPSTIRIPTPYYQLETMAFIRADSNIKINTIKDLKQYQIVKVRGVKHTNNITKGMTNVKDLDTTTQMLRLVSAGLADVALTNTVDGLVALKKLKITNVRPISKSLDRQSLYHYVHKSLQHLVPKVDQEIKKMKETGDLDALIRDAEQQVLKTSLDQITH